MAATDGTSDRAGNGATGSPSRPPARPSVVAGLSILLVASLVVTAPSVLADVDADCRDELAVGRNAGGNMRWAVHEDDAEFYEQIHAVDTWGDTRAATALAYGELDGDAGDELVLGRNPGGNMRWAVHDDEDQGFQQLLSAGEGWGNTRGTTAAATGDVDGDGLDEIAVGRNAGGNMRWAIHDDAAHGFAQMLSEGEGWGDGRGTTALAMGDVDGDGLDEIAVGRNAGGNMRWAIHDDAAHGFAQILSAGEGWGDSRGATALAFGNVDGDVQEEIAVGRNPGTGMYVAIYDDAATEFGLLFWYGIAGAERGVTALAFGNVDSDVRAELAVGRNPGPKWRWAIFDDAVADWTPLFAVASWGNNRGVTRLAFGDRAITDSDGDGLPDCWEAQGVDVDGDGAVDVDLPGLGADPNHKDLFVEFDWVVGQEPTRAAIQAMKEAFAAAPIDAGGKPNPDGTPGINLWVDTGGLADPKASEDGAGVGTCGDSIDNGSDGATDAGDPDCLVGDDLGGGNPISIQVGCVIDDPIFPVLKGFYFDPHRAAAFRYGISGSGGCKGGQSDGTDFVDNNHDPGTIMHELGHTLGLGHGGFESANCKPNYVSVMNYDQQGGIWQQVGTGGQDLDGDGIVENRIVDYSPPRHADGRGSSPLDTLTENDLDETSSLDGSDPSNMFIFTDGDGDKVRTPLESTPDWNGDGDTVDQGVQVNIDTSGAGGGPADCTNGTTDDELEGHDDWAVVTLRPPADAGGEAVASAQREHLDPTLEELQALAVEVNTTDLSLSATDAPDPVRVGQELVYTYTIHNQGPNPSSATTLDGQLASEVSYVGDDGGCVTARNRFACPIGELLAGERAVVSITVLVERAAPDTVITTVAEARNDAGPDPDRADNRSLERTAVSG